MKSNYNVLVILYLVLFTSCINRKDSEMRNALQIEVDNSVEESNYKTDFSYFDSIDSINSKIVVLKEKQRKKIQQINFLTKKTDSLGMVLAQLGGSSKHGETKTIGATILKDTNVLEKLESTNEAVDDKVMDTKIKNTQWSGITHSVLILITIAVLFPLLYLLREIKKSM